METKSKIKNTKPPWLKVKACGNSKYLEVQSLLKKYNLHTVCQEANCPNRGECFSSGTATFLIMGPNCTRNCTFCNVTHGNMTPLDDQEPAHVARTVAILDLEHAVITSVTRDDLPDGGAGQFAAVIVAIMCHHHEERMLWVRVVRDELREDMLVVESTETTTSVLVSNVTSAHHRYHLHSRPVRRAHAQAACTGTATGCCRRQPGGLPANT